MRTTVASQIYKRNTRWIMVLLGFVVVFASNVDAIGATQELYQDDAARAAIPQQATGIVETYAAQGGNEAKIADCASEKIDTIEGEIALPVGWTSGRGNIDGWHLLGWLIAGIALGQGAPFLVRHPSSSQQASPMKERRGRRST
jgi:hypothetical protein